MLNNSPGARKTKVFKNVLQKLKKSLVDVVQNYILMFETMQAVIKWIFVPMTLFWPFFTVSYGMVSFVTSYNLYFPDCIIHI